ncbi:MAG TPA: hypothetical protein VFF69_04950 [Phycisphaerales bacterium]|nr:hypothetical protein [Phycisphaerales bacterium]
MRSQAFEEWLAGLGYWECELVGVSFVLLAFAPWALSRLVMLVVDPPRRVSRPYNPFLDRYLPLILMAIVFAIVFPILLLGAFTVWSDAWPRTSLRAKTSIGGLAPAGCVAILAIEVLLALPSRKLRSDGDALELPPELAERLVQLREEQARRDKPPPDTPE